MIYYALIINVKHSNHSLCCPTRIDSHHTIREVNAAGDPAAGDPAAGDPAAGDLR